MKWYINKLLEKQFWNYLDQTSKKVIGSVPIIRDYCDQNNAIN